MIFFKDSEPTVRFASHTGAPEISEITRIKLAKEIKPDWYNKVKNNKINFSTCPGMDDWLRTGYIVPAWTDIEIKANKAGTIIKLYNNSYKQPERMDDRYVNGIIDIDADVKFGAWKLPSPWAVFSKPGYSAHVMPALFHSPFLRDLFVYPGTVDYDKFSTINLIFSPIRACEISIPAGTPLLHVIPFKREDITAEYSSGTETDKKKHGYGFPTRVTSAYRKFFHSKKNYSLKKV